MHRGAKDMVQSVNYLLWKYADLSLHPKRSISKPNMVTHF